GRETAYTTGSRSFGATVLVEACSEFPEWSRLISDRGVSRSYFQSNLQLKYSDRLKTTRIRHILKDAKEVRPPLPGPRGGMPRRPGRYLWISDWRRRIRFSRRRRSWRRPTRRSLRRRSSTSPSSASYRSER